jgi:hypothetical protein
MWVNNGLYELIAFIVGLFMCNCYIGQVQVFILFGKSEPFVNFIELYVY